LPEGGARPDIIGYDRTVQELHRVNVTLTHLLRATTRNYSITLPVGPMYPYEVAELNKARENLAELDAEIAASMKTTVPQWKRKEA
jgi:hypothetical protein